MNRNIAVLGSGPTGCVMAAWLTGQGFQVTLCDLKEHSFEFNRIRAQGGIRITGVMETDAPVMPCRMTCDFEETFRENDTIVVCAPAQRHEALAESSGPYIRREHAVLISPGNLGSVFFRKYAPEGAVTGECCGNIWTCRRTGEGTYLVAMPLKPLTVSAYPSGDTEKLIERFSFCFELQPGKNILETTLNSPNVASHLPGTILNAVAIEKNPGFCLFQDGLGPVLAECIEAVETEIDAVFEKTGLRRYAPHSKGLLGMLMEMEDAPEKYPQFQLFRSLDGPSSFRHRYLTEDAECGAALLVSLGDLVGAPVENMRAFLRIAGLLNQTDYLRNGRTLENMGLALEDL